MNTCCSEALMKKKQCLQLGPLMNSFSRKAWALCLWMGSVFLRGFLTSHTHQAGHCSSLWEHCCGAPAECAVRPSSSKNRVAKARSIGHRPELSGYTGFTVLSTEHFECFGVLCISFHTSPLHRTTLIIGFPF